MVVAITDSQLTAVNVCKVQLDRYMAVADTTTKALAECHVVLVREEELISLLTTQKEELQALRDQDAKMYSVQSAEIKTLLRQLRWQKIKAKVLGGTFGSTTAILAGVVIFLVVSHR